MRSRARLVAQMEVCKEDELKFLQGQVRMLRIEEHMPLEIDSLLAEFDRVGSQEKEERDVQHAVVQSRRAG